jgi:hypothetical protein
LNLAENILIGFRGNKRDRKPFGAKTTSTTNSVKIAVGISRAIIIDDNVNTLDINTPPKDVRSYENSLFERLELLITCDSNKSGQTCQSDNWLRLPIFLRQT